MTKLIEKEKKEGKEEVREKEKVCDSYPCKCIS